MKNSREKIFLQNILIVRQHPHKISSKYGLNDYGIYILEKTIQQDEVIEFKDIAIIFVKKAKIDDALNVRKKHNIDPTKGEIFVNYFKSMSTI